MCIDERRVLDGKRFGFWPRRAARTTPAERYMLISPQSRPALPRVSTFELIPRSERRLK